MAQAEWEAKKALRDALANRLKMNKALAHHFAYGPNAALAAKYLSSTPTASPFVTPFASPAASPIRALSRRMSGFSAISPSQSPEASPLRRGPSSREPSPGPGGGGASAPLRRGPSAREYEDRRRGLVQVGTWRVRLEETSAEEVAGGRGIQALVDFDWDFREQHCPVLASRVVLSEGRHLFRVKLRERHGDPSALLAVEGLIKARRALRHTRTAAASCAPRIVGALRSDSAQAGSARQLVLRSKVAS